MTQEPTAGHLISLICKVKAVAFRLVPSLGPYLALTLVLPPSPPSSIQLVSLLVHTAARTSFLKCRSSPMVPWFAFHGSRYPSTEPP